MIATERGEGVSGLSSASVWGLVRTALSEHPGQFVLLDADESLTSANANELLAEVLASGELQLALRSGKLRAPRLQRTAADVGMALPAESQAWKLRSQVLGSLDGLELVAQPERAVAAG